MRQNETTMDIHSISLHEGSGSLQKKSIKPVEIKATVMTNKTHSFPQAWLNSSGSWKTGTLQLLNPCLFDFSVQGTHESHIEMKPANLTIVPTVIQTAPLATAWILVVVSLLQDYNTKSMGNTERALNLQIWNALWSRFFVFCSWQWDPTVDAIFFGNCCLYKYQ